LILHRLLHRALDPRALQARVKDAVTSRAQASGEMPVQMKNPFIRLILHRLLHRDKRPTFNFPIVRPAIKCGAHKKEGMVDVHHAKCDVAGCDTRSYLNFPIEPPPPLVKGDFESGQNDAVEDNACTLQREAKKKSRKSKNS